MTALQAIGEIKKRYPELPDILVLDYQEGFPQFSGRDIETLIEYFKENYDYQNPPKWPFFSKAAYKLELKRSGRSASFWRVCGKCSQAYRNAGASCPSCGSYDFTMSTGPSLPQDVIMLQEDCTLCTLFPDRTADGRRIYGPDCQDHGSGRTPGEYCGSCECRLCCRLEGRAKENPDGFKRALQDGKVKFPYLKGFSE